MFVLASIFELISDVFGKQFICYCDIYVQTLQLILNNYWIKRMFWEKWTSYGISL